MTPLFIHAFSRARNLSQGATLTAALSLPAALAHAEDVYIQIEAQYGAEQAATRAEELTGTLPDLHGFTLPGGWFGLSLGPYPRAEAQAMRRDLIARGAIPDDSFLSSGDRYGAPIWPPAGAELAEAAPAPAPSDTPATTDPTPDPAALLAAAKEEGRRAEAALSRDERRALQRGLAFAGAYRGAIDGDFGPGTRGAISEWQASRGQLVTGVMTPAQMQALFDERRAALAAMGLGPVVQPATAITLDAPLALLEFDRLAPPFAIWRPAQQSGVELYLFSLPDPEGDQMGAMTDLIAALPIFPKGAKPQRGEGAMVLEGETGTLTSFAEAKREDGVLRGFILVWPQGDSGRRAPVLEAMRDSFAPGPGAPLGLPGDQPLSIRAEALWRGVENGGPHRAGSGFYAGPQGQALTAAALVQSCTRLTMDGQNARLIAQDPATGLALIAPQPAQAPDSLARLAPTGLPAPGQPIALAGFSWPGALPSAVVTMGQMLAAPGVDGDATLASARIARQSGDTGGPVLNAAGDVAGLLLPLPSQPGRAFPPELAPIRSAAALAGFLSGAGVPVASPAPEAEALSPADLAARGRALAVEVSCY